MNRNRGMEGWLSRKAQRSVNAEDFANTCQKRMKFYTNKKEATNGKLKISKLADHRHKHFDINCCNLSQVKDKMMDTHHKKDLIVGRDLRANYKLNEIELLVQDITKVT